jgi:TRAP-type C4-dicarboxylate transport system permease large subunit
MRVWQRPPAVSFGALSLVIAGAVILAQAVSILAIPRSLIDMIDAFELSPYALLLAVIVLYLLLGCFFDGLSLMIMTLPFVFPVMTAAGFDPVWLGVVVTIMVEVGMITPPVGMNLFVIAGSCRPWIASRHRGSISSR